MKILIVGDSFAADWTIKYPGKQGWPNLLAETYQVDNAAQVGISEYKIYKQLKSKVINNYDLILVAHASPWRIPTVHNIIHTNDLLLTNSDLIFSDVEYHSKKITNLFNKPIQSAFNFFKYHYDEEFFKLNYDLLREKINTSFLDKKFLILNFRDIKYSPEKEVLNLHNIVLAHGGLINHVSKEGNEKIFIKIMERINEYF